ncbi:MAG: PAS domain-containing protein, partial [Rhodoferax sp.]|nr:PAS domain-containing protein [Rhodoferax sp.]
MTMPPSPPKRQTPGVASGLAELDQSHQRIAQWVDTLSDRLGAGPEAKLAAELVRELANCKALSRQLQTDVLEQEFVWREAERSGLIGGWRADLARNAFSWTAGACAMLEMAPGAVTRMDEALAAFEPASAARIAEHLQAAFAGNGAFTLRAQIRAARSGNQKWVEFSGQALRNPDGRIEHLAGTMLDISADVLAHEELRRRQAAVDEVQQLAKVGTWQLDMGSGSLDWSNEVYRIFELDPADFKATYAAFLDRVHPDDRDAVNGAYANSLATRQPYAIRHRLRMADGRIKHVQEQCQTFFDDNGEPLRSLGTVQDVTEQVHTEVELQASRNLLQAVIDHVPMRVFWKDRAL